MQLGWIDFSKEDRQKAFDVINLLSEQGAVDELGIGVIRDAFANYFFPGTSTIQTRAKYFLIVPYMLRLKIETVKDSDEKEWIGVFTSSEEMHKGSAGNVQMNQSIESILRLALNWEQVNGIVINPFGKYIQMTKKMIELLINGYEYNENERKSKDDENN